MTKVRQLGLKPKAEVGIHSASRSKFAGSIGSLGNSGSGLDDRPGQAFLDAGAYMIMIESEGITESVKPGKPMFRRSH